MTSTIHMMLNFTYCVCTYDSQDWIYSSDFASELQVSYPIAYLTSALGDVQYS